MEEVPRELLVPGHEYYIASLTWSSDEQDRVPNTKFPKVMGTFMGLSPSNLYENFHFALFSDYRGVCECSGYNVSLNDMWRFYPVKKHLIQQAMERRALTTILRNITGDDYFSWP